jgi:dipeptidyl aminopeptidase/acylaminoacyl peptidase
MLAAGTPMPGAQPPAADKAKRPTAPTAKAPSFHRDVLPIFRTACIGCHSMENPTSGLILTSYGALMKGGKGGAALVPGKGAESRLVKYLTGELKPQMPPGSGLKPKDIEAIRRWVDAGAKEDAPITEPTRKTLLPAGKTPAREPRSVVAPTGKPLTDGPMLPVPAPVTALAFSPDGKTLAVGTYREVVFWNVETQAVAGRWRGHTDAVLSLAYTQDGKLLAAAGGVSGVNGEVRLWDTTAGRETRKMGEHTDTVLAVAFSPDGTKLATGSQDKSVRVWETGTGKPLALLRDHADAVDALAFSPDGKYLASGGLDRSFKVWDLATYKRRYSITGHNDAVTGLVFSPDGAHLLSASADRSVKVWAFSADGCNPVRTLGGHEGAVLSVALTTDGKTVATASADKTTRLWRFSDGGQIAALTDAKDWVYTARFSPDGARLAAGTWDGSMLLWNAAEGKLIQQFPLK